MRRQVDEILWIQNIKISSAAAQILMKMEIKFIGVKNKNIIFVGSFKNCKKIGRWDIMYCKRHEEEYKQIGGGSYDQKGNQKKIEIWVELDENFRDWKWVTLNGKYNQNGQKVGIWIEMDTGEQQKRRKKI